MTNSDIKVNKIRKFRQQWLWSKKVNQNKPHMTKVEQTQPKFNPYGKYSSPSQLSSVTDLFIITYRNHFKTFFFQTVVLWYVLQQINIPSFAINKFPVNLLIRVFLLTIFKYKNQIQLCTGSFSHSF